MNNPNKHPDNQQTSPLEGAFVRGVHRAAGGPIDQLDEEYGHAPAAAEAFTRGVEQTATGDFAVESARRDAATGNKGRMKRSGAATVRVVNIPVDAVDQVSDITVHAQHFNPDDRYAS